MTGIINNLNELLASHYYAKYRRYSISYKDYDYVVKHHPEYVPVYWTKLHPTLKQAWIQLVINANKLIRNCKGYTFDGKAFYNIYINALFSDNNKLHYNRMKLKEYNWNKLSTRIQSNWNRLAADYNTDTIALLPTTATCVPQRTTGTIRVEDREY